MHSASEGPEHPGKVSECGCTAQGSIRTQQGWPHGSWGHCNSLPKPLASLTPTQHVLGKAAAMTAATAATASRQYPSSWTSRAAFWLSATAGGPSKGTLLSQHPARSKAQLWCSRSAPCSAKSDPPAQRAKAELGQLPWAHRPYLVPLPRMFPLPWTCTRHCGDILHPQHLHTGVAQGMESAQIPATAPSHGSAGLEHQSPGQGSPAQG